MNMLALGNLANMILKGANFVSEFSRNFKGKTKNIWQKT